MTSATLQITVIPKRMLTKPEAAHHCGRSVKRFEIDPAAHDRYRPPIAVVVEATVAY